jgi:S-adenosylmethionine:tRNA ribosyltransferase-isomerase
MAPGDPIVFSGGLHGAIESVSPEWPRFVSIRFPLADCELWRSLYRAAQPVQYAHLAGPLQVWHQQTAYAARPWSVEPPSAGLSLSWHLLDELTRHGVELAFLTHGAGLSSTGDPAIDAALPFPERFDIPASTVEAVVHARKQGTRVVAVGTTVVRALEGCAAANQGALKPGEGTTGLAITGTFVPRIVSGILTGIHETGSSHHRLLEAFAPAPLLRAASARAEETAYLSHEFGDAMLVLPASSLRHGKA